MPPPRRKFDRQAYFDGVYARSAAFTDALAKRFALSGKRVVSIGAGSCAEEIRLAQAGARLDCVEPLAAPLALARERAAALAPGAAIAFHACRHQDFAGDSRFDLIYASCPQDWMSGRFRDLVPDDYLRFLSRHAAPDCVLAVKFWGDSYSADVLRTQWFAAALHRRLRLGSDFRLRELWRTRSAAHAMAVCVKGTPADDTTVMLDGWAERFDDPGSRTEYWSASTAVAPSRLQRLVPYGLVLRHAARRVRQGLQRRLD